MEGTVSQIFFLGLSFNFILKKGRFSGFFLATFSAFDKMRTKIYIKNLRHKFLHMNLTYRYLRFWVSNCIIKRDISVQKM